MREGQREIASGMMSWLLGMALGLMVLAMLCVSCSPIKYVPVETVRTEYVEADTTGLYERMRSVFESMYRKETSSDSIIDRTKETVVLKENGDTARHDKERIVYVASHREKELEHMVQQQDSTIKALRLQLASVKSDSIPVPYPVEKELSRWEQTKMDFGGIAIVTFIAVVIVVIVRRAKK
ncbi:MAG: hypothetical protein K2J65_11105 [Duncaniella sp.]|nr:hypothetical protein [Duncaniella sp.]